MISILFSARIVAGQAIKVARALTDAGWITADKLAATSWKERAQALNRHGYARYDERTASMLGEVGVGIFFRRPRSPGRSCSRWWTGGPPQAACRLGLARPRSPT